jgi:hypothetical protein
MIQKYVCYTRHTNKRLGVSCMQAVAGACGIVLLTNADSLIGGGLAAPLRTAVASAMQGVLLPLLVLVADAPAGCPVGFDPAKAPPQSEAADQAAVKALVQHLDSTNGYSSESSSGRNAPAMNMIGIAGQAGLSDAALLQGLAWLAEHSPPQPRLWVQAVMQSIILPATCHHHDDHPESPGTSSVGEVI